MTGLTRLQHTQSSQEGIYRLRIATDNWHLSPIPLGTLTQTGAIIYKANSPMSGADTVGMTRQEKMMNDSPERRRAFQEAKKNGLLYRQIMKRKGKRPTPKY